MFKFGTKDGDFVFLTPLALGGLGATHAVPFRLTGKLLVNFVLVTTYFARYWATQWRQVSLGAANDGCRPIFSSRTDDIFSYRL